MGRTFYSGNSSAFLRIHLLPHFSALTFKVVITHFMCSIVISFLWAWLTDRFCAVGGTLIGAVRSKELCSKWNITYLNWFYDNWHESGRLKSSQRKLIWKYQSYLQEHSLICTSEMFQCRRKQKKRLVKMWQVLLVDANIFVPKFQLQLSPFYTDNLVALTWGT